MAPIGASRLERPPAAERERPCPHFPRCPGCALIGRPYGEQLAWKEQRIAALLAGASDAIRPELTPIVGSARAFGYRNQAKLVLRQTRRGLLAGLYRPGTHQVVDVRFCPVHVPAIQQALPRVLASLEQSGIPAYDERSRAGALRYLLLRYSEWQRRLQLILVTATALEPRLRAALRALARVPRVSSVVHDHNPEPGNVLLAHRFTVVSGRLELLERVGPFRMRVQAGTFLQANLPVARRLYQYAAEQAQPSADGVAMDLYCGAGALSLYLAAKARLVIGIEENPAAVADAKSNARLNGCGNLRFFPGTTQAVVPELARKFGPVQVVTLNPPRKGVDQATLEAVVQLAAERLVYVSCSPTTLIRDLRFLAQHGYRTIRVRPFDLMPQTDHIECVATLERTG